MGSDTRTLTSVLGIGVLGLLCACADEEGPLACPDFKPSAGFLGGAWEAVDFCFGTNASPLNDDKDCRQYPTIVEGVAFAGKMEFGPNDQFRNQTVATLSSRFKAPLTCLVSAEVNKKITSCEAWADFANNTFAGGLPIEKVPLPGDKSKHFAQVFCKSTDKCDCTIIQRLEFNVTTKYRTTQEGTIVTDTDTADDGPMFYSIVGDELRLRNKEAVMRLVRP